MKRMKFLIVAAWMAGMGTVWAQGLTEKADRALANLNYPKAARLYERALSAGPNGDVAHKLGEYYLRIGEPDRAVQTLAPYNKSAQSKPAWQLTYAKALQACGKYAEASKAYNFYAQQGDDPETGRAWAKACDDIAVMAAKPSGFELKPLPYNTANSEFGAVQTPSGTWIAVNQTRGGLVHPLDPTTEKSCYDLVTVQANQGKKPFAVAKGRINSRYHDGPVSFSAQADTAYLTRSNALGGKLGRDAQGYNHLQLLETHLVKGRWSKPVALPFCDPAFSTAHASISPDRQWMYFASDRPGGYGGSDIYRVARTSGGWGKPENLGPSVNTGGNEFFPSFHGNTLYFSTNGRPGFGGLDLYASTLNEEGWSEASNLGTPLNSASDDFAMVWDAKSLSGTISSNRLGGRGSDDVYRFTQKIWIEVEAVASNDQSAVPNTKMTALGTRGTVVNLMTDEAGKAGFFAQGNEDFKVELSHGRYESVGRVVNASAVDASGKVLSKFDMTPLHFVEATVVDKSTGKALPGAQVQVVQGTDHQKLATEADGTFSVKAENRNKARVVVAMAGYKPAIVELEPSFGSQKPKQLKLEPGNYALIQGTCVNAKTGSPVEGAKVRALDSASTKLLDSDFSQGDGSYFLAVERGAAHRLLASGHGYFVASLGLGAKGLVATDTALTVPLVECKVGEIVKIIHFDYKSSLVKAVDAPQLNEVVVFMQENPEASIEILSHTDCRGSDPSNLHLSEERAKASKDYLVSKKVQASRMTTKGMGETAPVHPCADDHACDEAQHAANRRSEFKITHIQLQEK